VKDTNFHVTVVIPVFNEQDRIAKTLYDTKDFLSAQPYNSDILIIDDGSEDLTAEVIRVVDHYGEEVKAQNSGAIIENIKNVGKGYSIAKGLLLAKGDFIVFTDADQSTPISEISKLINKLEDGYDVVVGSRNLKTSEIINRPVVRLFLSKCFNTIASLMGLLRVSDSQCGFKAYRRNAGRDVAGRQKTYGFCFDVEHIHTATKLGYRVAEVPVKWTHDDGSTLSLCNDSLSMLLDLIKIRWIHRKL